MPRAHPQLDAAHLVVNALVGDRALVDLKGVTANVRTVMRAAPVSWEPALRVWDCWFPLTVRSRLQVAINALVLARFQITSDAILLH